uniref:Trypsin inhibitor DE5 alpha chain n=1 Tax=Adenanthera pavonina TaxID=3811 RepID=ID5A_ADEPA|nr:RecName: Full=Trypsin inhibitor DE5 alpha chain [Adenanthera pavonina]
RELLDVDGNFLRNGGSYYIVPAFRGKGGGLELARTGSETCPRTVVQAPAEQSRGLPARLSTPPRIRYIGPEFYLTIEFEEQKPPSCLRDSNLQWKVEEESQIVKIASKEEEQLFGSFQIKPYRDDYKLVYCEPQQGGR